MRVYFRIGKKKDAKIVCPPVYEREGDAHEHNGSTYFASRYIRGTVIHRQQTQ